VKFAFGVIVRVAFSGHQLATCGARLHAHALGGSVSCC
jgi:hypothetical protein